MNTKRLPDIFYNWWSVVGAFVAVVSFSVILLLLLIDIFLESTTLYLGLLTFMVLPGFLFAGLVLIALGALIERRKLARGVISTFPRQVHIDLENASHRNAVVIWSIGTTIFLLGTTVGTYKAYQTTESVIFCGELCHNVMAPEYTAYQVSAHANVSCAECHIGPGAEWFVKAKLSGLHQVYAVLTDTFQRPISTPIENLRPARETCEHCHWPEKFFGGRQKILPHFLSDEENTPYPISMLLNIGGGNGDQAEGIHWHVAKSHHMEYIATDHDRKDIVWVRLTKEDGSIAEYTLGGEPLGTDIKTAHSPRSVDCLDCHNRPSHNYRSPIKIVNQALHLGKVDVSLPYVKREAVTVFDREYETTPNAMQAIETHLTNFYQEEYPDLLKEKSDVIAQTITSLQKGYRENFFPEMKVSWKAYPDHVGHSEFLGCFRCHGSELETTDGGTISKDCNLCHTILSQGTKEQAMLTPGGIPFRHPVDIDGAELEANCTECHEGGAELY
ncbi:MAG: hypothetical protein ACI8V2_001401 [Candidatus Latescibacterota bacterium]|jgi:hypothetical protein